jgi:hypothetical protein
MIDLKIRRPWSYQMVVEEIFHTCSNPHLARAALASIGGEFSSRFASEASRHNNSPGGHAALMVKAFAEAASPEDIADVSRAARGSDQPILAGFRHILARTCSLF